MIFICGLLLWFGLWVIAQVLLFQLFYLLIIINLFEVISQILFYLSGPLRNIGGNDLGVLFILRDKDSVAKLLSIILLHHVVVVEESGPFDDLNLVFFLLILLALPFCFIAGRH
jgi:hypothetical protein